MDFFTNFDRRRFIGYSYFRIPSELNEEVGRAVRFLREQPSDGKERLASALGDLQGEVLVAYGWRMAELAVRRRDRTYVILSLVALANANATDPREALMTMSLPYHSAKKLGEDPSLLFVEAARASTQAGQRWLLTYASRDETDKDIDVMAFEGSSDGDGFTYRSTL